MKMFTTQENGCLQQPVSYGPKSGDHFLSNRLTHLWLTCSLNLSALPMILIWVLLDLLDHGLPYDNKRRVAP